MIPKKTKPQATERPHRMSHTNRTFGRSWASSDPLQNLDDYVEERVTKLIHGQLVEVRTYTRRRYPDRSSNPAAPAQPRGQLWD